MVLFSSLEEEIGNLRIAAEQSGGLTWKDRLKPAWKEETMIGLLQQIRGQEASLTLLLQSLQMYSFYNAVWYSLHLHNLLGTQALR
jgi:hypothetical protein